MRVTIVRDGRQGEEVSVYSCADRCVQGAAEDSSPIEGSEDWR